MDRHDHTTYVGSVSILPRMVRHKARTALANCPIWATYTHEVHEHAVSIVYGIVVAQAMEGKRSFWRQVPSWADSAGLIAYRVSCFFKSRVPPIVESHFFVPNETLIRLDHLLRVRVQTPFLPS